MKEISKSIIEQTNVAYDRFIESGKIVGDHLVEYVNNGREVGIFLNTLKANEPHWQQLTLTYGNGHDEESRLNFGTEHAKTFMRMADKMKEPATTSAEAMSSIKEVMMLQGALPFPEGHGQQQLHERDPLSIVIRHAMEIQATFNKEIRDQISEWTPERRQHTRDQLKPIVDIYNALAA